MVNFQRNVPEKYQDAEWKYGAVYLTMEFTPELEAEGFSREVTRHVQSLRKKAGLEKVNRISLWLKVSEKLKEYLKQHKQEMKEKVGADEFMISTEETAENYEQEDSFKVKGEECQAFFSKTK